MTKPTNEELLKVITSTAKETLEETKQHITMFVIELVDGMLQLVVVPELTDDTKSALITKLKQTVEELGSERYLMISECYGINQAETDARIKELEEAIAEGNLYSKELLETVTSLRDLRKRPSEHPLRHDLLMVALYDKHTGTYMQLHPFEIKNDKVIWHKDAFDNEGAKSAYSRFNIWHPYQFDLDADEE